MRKWILLFAASSLAACAWNPVLTPYAVNVPDQAPDSDVATVWGVREGATLHFTHVDGDSLPSRGGGGYPLSLKLEPGKHTLKFFFVTADHRSTEEALTAEVEAGHTYVVEHLVIPGTPAVAFQLSDKGKDEVCSYERTDQVRGTAVLHCAKR